MAIVGCDVVGLGGEGRGGRRTRNTMMACLT